MKSSMRWFPQFVAALIGFVVFINVVSAAMQPYMPMIGKTFAGLIIILGLAVVGFVVFMVTRVALNHVSRGGDDEM